jgi:uncharacterized protein YdhG (YjbR/CyaY superfamily)
MVGLTTRPPDPRIPCAGQGHRRFAAFKEHLSYLPFSGSVLGQLGDELNGHSMAKSALHFAAEHPLPEALVKKLIAARLKQLGQRSP